MTFEAFAARAETLFGLSASEAADLADVLEERFGYDLGEITTRSRTVWGDAADVIEEFLEDVELEDGEEYGEEESPYELDPFWPEDDYLDAGEEWELSPDYKEN